MSSYDDLRDDAAAEGAWWDEARDALADHVAERYPNLDPEQYRRLFDAGSDFLASGDEILEVSSDDGESGYLALTVRGRWALDHELTKASRSASGDHHEARRYTPQLSHHVPRHRGPHSRRRRQPRRRTASREKVDKSDRDLQGEYLAQVSPNAHATWQAYRRQRGFDS